MGPPLQKINYLYDRSLILYTILGGLMKAKISNEMVERAIFFDSLSRYRLVLWRLG